MSIYYFIALVYPGLGVSNDVKGVKHCMYIRN